MTPYEIMLSESQERMLLVLRQGAEAKARAVFAKWDLDCVTVGRVTDTRRDGAALGGKEVAEVPIAPVSGGSPVYRAALCRDAPCPAGDRPALRRCRRSRPPTRCAGCSAAPIWRPSAGSSSSTTTWSWATRCSARAAMRRWSAFTAATGDWHSPPTARPATASPIPRRGGRQAVAEAWRNLCAVGARPLAVTDCLNFGSPENPVVMGQFVGCIEGMAEACRALDFPVVSGNVSFYNETDGQAIRPTPTIGGLGLIEDLDRMATLAYGASDLALVLIGEYLRVARQLALPARGLRPRGGRAAAGRSGDRAAERRAGARADRARLGRRQPRSLRRRPLRGACRDGAGLRYRRRSRAARGWRGQARLAVRRGPGALSARDHGRAPRCSCSPRCAGRACLARRVGTTGGGALTLGRRRCHMLGRTRRGPRTLAAVVHGHALTPSPAPVRMRTPWR